MTTALTDRPNVLKKDADGRWYSIPSNEEDAFVQAVEATMLSEFMTAEWNEANDDLESQYGQYRKDEL